MNSILGIVGGVGPKAGLRFHQLIIDGTHVLHADQGHVPVMHFSFSNLIPDRTQYLLGKHRNNPAQSAAMIVKQMADAMPEGYDHMLVGIPCNTFHAPPIFEVYKQLTRSLEPRVEIVDMMATTFDYLAEKYPFIQRVGILTTTGTRMIGHLRKGLERNGLSVIEVPLQDQPFLHDCIYHPTWGIKSTPVVTEQACLGVMSLTDKLLQRGAELVILGCSELPLVMNTVQPHVVPLVDPVEIMAQHMLSRIAPLHYSRSGEVYIC